MDGYKSASFNPIGVRTSIGTWGIQLGVDFNTNIKKPEFFFNDQVTGKNFCTETFKDSYLGAMLRFPMADKVEQLEVIVRGGAGVCFSEKSVKYSSDYLFLHPELYDLTHKFKNSFACNVAIGFSYRLGNFLKSRLHLNIEGQYNYNERKYSGQTNFYTSWVVQTGLSYNIIDDGKKIW